MTQDHFWGLIALSWFESDLSDKMQSVMVVYAVPQGFVLSPVLITVQRHILSWL